MGNAVIYSVQTSIWALVIFALKIAYFNSMLVLRPFLIYQQLVFSVSYTDTEARCSLKVNVQIIL